MSVPSLQRGRPSMAERLRYDAELQEFCARILEIDCGLDFRVSSRGWCYVLEGKGVITKGEFDDAQRLINVCRKSGALPLEICAVDERREAEGADEYIDENGVEEEADAIVEGIAHQHQFYNPFSFWDDLPFYLELAVEKVDLRSLFSVVARQYHIPISNIAGWCDINGRAAMMRRFAQHEQAGRQCVLLYCGDHDPGGLHISSFLRSNMAELSNAVGWKPDNLIIDRFGLSFDFIEAQGLTWIDNLETSSGGRLDDPRHPDHRKPYVQDYLARFGARKCEANALVVRPAEGRALFQDAILRYIPPAAVHAFNGKVAWARIELKLAIAQRMGVGQ